MAKKAKNLEFKTGFSVQPQHTNYMDTLFGGKLVKEMDICAGMTAKRLLYASECDRAVTAHLDDVDFLVPGNVGDIIFLRGRITGLGTTSINIQVTAKKETNQSGEKVDMCDAQFVFVSVKDGDPYPHNLKL